MIVAEYSWVNALAKKKRKLREVYSDHTSWSMKRVKSMHTAKTLSKHLRVGYGKRRILLVQLRSPHFPGRYTIPEDS
ncbi:hypothetical protein RB195_017110 [Necator americanus]|uniref:Uncharacterized protein n=1 Tax=Necator americanus TaxID=51031 RepID=A0ABR1C664_NECAM